MLDIRLLREEPERIRQAVQNRGWSVDLEAVRVADETYRIALQSVEERRADIKRRSAQMPSESEREAIRKLKEALRTDEAALAELWRQRDARLRELPNIPRDDVPIGPGESANVVMRTVGEPPTFAFEPRSYLRLAAEHDLIDLERASKVSGARFAYLKGEAALLSWALVRYGLDLARRAGFTPVIPPVLIGESAMAGMGYLDHGGEEETYHFPKDNLYLVGTSEQAIGPMHMDEIFDEPALPRRYVAFSTCFRREAGSYGQDTQGILRVHQFDKLELFSFTTPERSDDEHLRLLSLEEQFMTGLKLPYRVVALCTGDLYGPSARTYDIEVWIPSQGRYRETHSTSTTTDFQARRLHIRYRAGNGAIHFVHCLNGTMVAVNRPLIAILENYQRADGTVQVPEVLQTYVGQTVIG